MSKTLILMQGIPGSGKSTVAAAIARDKNAAIFSTDDYWLMEGDGAYRFDPDKLGEAHRWNQQEVARAMVDDDYPDTFIIDNTNIKQRDVEPYLMLAQIFEYEVQVVRVECDPEVAIERNQQRPEDRIVPSANIMRMYDSMERLDV